MLITPLEVVLTVIWQSLGRKEWKIRKMSNQLVKQKTKVCKFAPLLNPSYIYVKIKSKKGWCIMIKEKLVNKYEDLFEKQIIYRGKEYHKNGMVRKVFKSENTYIAYRFNIDMSQK